jgi:hypothetical protein
MYPGQKEIMYKHIAYLAITELYNRGERELLKKIIYYLTPYIDNEFKEYRHLRDLLRDGVYRH